MPTEISNANPFAGLEGGGGGISNTGGGGYNPPQTNFLGAIIDARNAAAQQEYRQQEIDMAKAKLAQAQQEMQGKRMAGAFASRAYDPETGKMDYNQWLTDMASHPLTQPMFEESYQTVLNNGLVEANTLKARIDTAKERSDALGRTAYGLIQQAKTDGTDIEPADVARGVMNNVTLGLMTMDDAQKIVANLPAKGQKLNAAVLQFANEANLESQSLGRVQSSQAWEPSEQGGQDLVQTDAFGKRQVTAHKRDVLGAGQLNEVVPVQTTGQDGSPQTINMTKQQQLERMGQTQNLPDNPDGSPVMPGQVPGIAPPPSTRQAAESASTTARNEGYKTTVQDEADEANVRVGMLRTARDLVGKVSTGGGADFKRTLARIASSVGASPDYVNSIANGDLASLEKLGGLNTLLSVSNFKNITQQANRDLGQMEFERMQQAGFDINNTKDTNKFVINYMLGAQELKLRKAQMLEKWQDSGKPVEKFRGAWTKYERELLQRGITRDPDKMLSHDEWVKGKRVEGMEGS
jgi:hypothetical protein